MADYSFINAFSKYLSQADASSQYSHSTPVIKGRNSNLGDEIPRSSGKFRNCRKNKGPCGIPALDEENFFPVFESNKELNLPINKAELETDFDFEANLALFDKDDISLCSSDDEISSKNPVYKNDENILSDPTRITTVMSHLSEGFYSRDIRESLDGFKIPYLTVKEKVAFLKCAEASITTDIFNDRVADRIHLFVQKIIERFKTDFDKVAIITSKMNNVQIVISLLHYFCNQCSTVYVYGSQFAFNSVKVLNVAKIDEIPVLNLQLVIFVCGVPLEIFNWIQALPKSVHALFLEKKPNLLQHEHLLMLGVGCDAQDTSILTKSSKFDCMEAVADIGISFLPMDSYSASCLAEAFSRQCLVLF